jgi:hypothetical protein
MTQAKNDSRNAAGLSLTTTAMVSRTHNTPSGYRRRNTSGVTSRRRSTTVQPAPEPLSSIGRNGGHTGSASGPGRGTASTPTSIARTRGPSSIPPPPAWIAARPSPNARTASNTWPRRESGGSVPAGRSNARTPARSRPTSTRAVTSPFWPPDRAGGIRLESGAGTSLAYISGMTPRRLISIRYRRCLRLPMRPVPPRT